MITVVECTKNTELPRVAVWCYQCKTAEEALQAHQAHGRMEPVEVFHLRREYYIRVADPDRPENQAQGRLA